MVTSAGRGGGKSSVGVGDKEVHAAVYKINYKAILYSTGIVANIL